MRIVTLTVLPGMLWLTFVMRAQRGPMPLNSRGSSCWTVSSSSVCFDTLNGAIASPNSCRSISRAVLFEGGSRRSTFLAAKSDMLAPSVRQVTCSWKQISADRGGKVMMLNRR